jgi:hypothetical protein
MVFFGFLFVGPFVLSKDSNFKPLKVSTQFQITKHLKLVVLLQRPKFFCGCFEFEALKVDLAPKTHGGPLNSPGVVISNHQTYKIHRFGSKRQKNLWVF